MFGNQSAKWLRVIASVIGIAASDAVFAYGGSAADFGLNYSSSGYPSDPQPISTNSNHFSYFPPVTPVQFPQVASHLIDRTEIVLFSASDTRREARYTLNGVPHVMQPGAMQRLKHDRVWTVEVNTETGRVLQYTLAPGGYKFRQTGLSMSMGLFATQDRPQMSTADSATETGPSVRLVRRTTTPATIAGAPTPMFDHPEAWLAEKELRRRFDAHPAPAITASRWFNHANVNSSEQFRDKVVLLDFWADWCGPCVQNLPKIQALYEKFKDRGLVVIGVHSPQGAESVAPFLANRRLSFPVAIDTGATAHRYGVDGFPTYVLIDKSGRQSWNLGHEAPHEQQIENLLRR